MMSTWKKYLLYAAYILIGIGILYGLLQLILAGYSVSWTGFGERTLSNGDVVGEKSLWDWMELLVIPLVLAIGAFLLNRSEKINDRNAAKYQAEQQLKISLDVQKDSQQEEAIQTYIDRMSDLLVKENLLETKKKSVQKIARTRTLTLLPRLDGSRKKDVLKFLYEAELIKKGKPIIKLEGADLSNIVLAFTELQEADLSKANFRNANMRTALLSNSDLSGAILRNAYLLGAFLSNARLNGITATQADLSFAQLPGAILIGANMTIANLSNADFSGSDLRGSTLTDAILQDADFTKANLQGAVVTIEQLEKAKSLKGATMPDGTIHE